MRYYFKTETIKTKEIKFGRANALYVKVIQIALENRKKKMKWIPYWVAGEALM
jgi:hypothetical protein